jgi:hypothetical protein
MSKQQSITAERKGVYIMDKEKLIFQVIKEVSKLNDKSVITNFAASLAHAENGHTQVPFALHPKKVG